MKPRHYLDYNATQPLRASAQKAMVDAFACFGNPSSIHAEGRAARRIVEDARKNLAGFLGRAPDDVIFTSGATEALGLALSPHWRERAKGRRALLMNPTEHAAVRQNHDFPAAEFLRVDSQGLLDLEDLRLRLSQSKGQAVLAVQAANNETGVIQDIPAIAALAQEYEAWLICDGVQALGRMDPDHFRNADFLIFSSHKIGGPKGVGALVLARQTLHNPNPRLRGGGQERGFRAGTENVPAIAGFDAALKEIAANWRLERAHCGSLRENFEAAFSDFPGEKQIFGKGAPRLSNVSALAFSGAKAENMVMALDLAGISCSSGSACSSGKISPSSVLGAMGVDPHMSKGALRFSFGWNSGQEDVDAVISALRTILNRLQRDPAEARGT